uniref:C2H2-type domain-containing protein n=1 Tax=Caenorhabditis japonica TaxID=281687 RepID=A0A8R1DT40_CAEJA
MTPSSFAELTPISHTASSCRSSTSSSADFGISVNTNDKVKEFNRLVAELGFDGEGEEDENVEEFHVNEDSEDEDLGVKYPYERRDKYEDLEERLQLRLMEREAETKEVDEKAEDLKQMLKHAAEKRKMEAKLNGTLHISGSIFTCVICSKAFSSAEQLQSHSNKSHDLERNKERCKLCGKSYKYRKNLVAHLAIHQKEYQCEKCDLVFQSAATLDNHIARHHAQEKTQVLDDYHEKKCKFCKKSVPAQTVKQHEWYCKNKERVLAKKKANLEEIKKNHLSHSVPASPAMSVASVSSFASFQPGPSSPVVSYRDKSCSVCGETFASRQSMIRHVGRKHPEVKDDPNVTAVRYVSAESPSHQYACPDCGKRLTTRAALTTHRARAHLTTNRHQCHICQKSYPVPSELRKHVQRVHEKASGSTTPVTVNELPDLESIF